MKCENIDEPRELQKVSARLDVIYASLDGARIRAEKATQDGTYPHNYIGRYNGYLAEIKRLQVLDPNMRWTEICKG
jgi:hypothetical protein